MALAKATTQPELLSCYKKLNLPPSMQITKSAIASSENPKYHSRNKHVDTQYHFTREKISQKKFNSHVYQLHT